MKNIKLKLLKLFKKKGFTLIELLATIIVLAIIALIATPIIMRVIENAKDGAAKRSVQNYLHTVDTEIVAKKVVNNNTSDGIYYGNSESDLCQSISCDNSIIIEMKGTKPSGGVVTIENGKVVRAIDLWINNRYYNYIDGEITSTKTPQAAGAYDENDQLVLNWDQLVSDGYITVNNNEITGSDKNKMSSVKVLIIPQDITSIETESFINCKSLTSVMLPSNVISIGEYAFKDCTDLLSIFIPSSVKFIGAWSFTGCKNLESIKISATNKVYEDRNSNAIIKKSDNSLANGCKNTVIPDGITRIGAAAFCGHSNLTSITIPNSVVGIGESAFSGCTGLTSITIPSSTTRIGKYAFLKCDNLESVVFKGTEDWSAGETQLLSSNLSDSETAATYLTDTYARSIWSRN